MSSEDEAPQRPASTAKPSMANFLRSDTSSSESDEESESESDEDGQGDDDESGGEDRPQVRILSAVDKRLKEMAATGVVIENALKINDWLAISNGSCLQYLSGYYNLNMLQNLTNLFGCFKSSITSQIWFPLSLSNRS